MALFSGGAHPALLSRRQSLEPQYLSHRIQVTHLYFCQHHLNNSHLRCVYTNKAHFQSLMVCKSWLLIILYDRCNYYYCFILPGGRTTQQDPTNHQEYPRNHIIPCQQPHTILFVSEFCSSFLTFAENVIYYLIPQRLANGIKCDSQHSMFVLYYIYCVIFLLLLSIIVIKGHKFTVVFLKLFRAVQNDFYSSAFQNP